MRAMARTPGFREKRDVVPDYIQRFVQMERKIYFIYSIGIIYAKQ